MAVRLEVTLFWYRPRCFCCVNQVVLMLTRRIYMTKAERSVSKQGHLQPRCHTKARSLSRQLQNGLFTLVEAVVLYTSWHNFKTDSQRKHKCQSTYSRTELYPRFLILERQWQVNRTIFSLSFVETTFILGFDPCFVVVFICFVFAITKSWSHLISGRFHQANKQVFYLESFVNIKTSRAPPAVALVCFRDSKGGQ